LDNDTGCLLPKFYFAVMLVSLSLRCSVAGNKWTGMSPVWSLLLVIFVFVKPLCAQELSYKKYGVKEGLPSLVVYHSMQDKNGFIWFATNRGVSRFDGKVFKNFSKEDGLPDNEILKLHVDKHNNVWFISFLGIPSVLYNDSIRQINCKGVFYIVEDLVDDSILLLSKQTNNNESLGYYKSLNRPGNWHFTGHFEGFPAKPFLNWSILRASTTAGIRFYFTYVNKKKNRLLIKTGKRENNFPIGGSAFNPFINSSFIDVAENKKGIIFNTGDSIYYADINGVRPLIYLESLGLNVSKKDVNSLFSENDSVLWLCTKNKGLIRISNFMSPSRLVQYFFSESYCSSILKDGEGGYSITTLNDGVYYVPNLNFFNLADRQGLITGGVKCIRMLDSRQLAAGFTNGTIIKIHLEDLKTDIFSKWGLENKNNRVLDIWPYRENRLVIGSDRGLYMLFPRQTYTELNDEQGIKGIYIKPDATIVSGSSTSVRLIDLDKNTIKRIYNNRVTCIAALGRNYFWGTMTGAYAFLDNSLVALGKKHPVLDSIISHIDIAPDSALWISTPEGIVILKKENLFVINKSQGLLSNRCKHVLFDSLTAWVSTDQGISRVDYRWKGNRFSFSISNIMEVDGLLSSDVNQTAVGGNYIWAATEDGISFFSKHYTSSPYTLPPVSITRIVSGNTNLPISDTIKISHKKRDLLVELFCPSYRSCGNINYEYRLSDLDSTWRATSNNYIEFSSLPFGEFVLEVSAINKWGQKTISPKRILIINTPPFWRSSWFSVIIYILTFFLIAAAFYFFNSARHRKKEQSYKITQKMRDLEIMALRAQMNPHFIFNCMTSIQYYILRTDVINANLYLHKFSTLIRKILQYSNISVISLTEEIKLLELYLELEKMRLKDRLNFRVLVKDNVDPDVLLVPPMIIQPYIENAIKHGISPLQNKKGVVTVTFERLDDYLHCIIDDNGIGINASKQNSRLDEEGHTSMGNSITEHRIITLNSLQKNKILLKIVDKQERNATDTGTVVHLCFPVINE
jgi:ligand-binding sensor domain-containing protein/two-component sensor histidine kinase